MGRVRTGLLSLMLVALPLLAACDRRAAPDQSATTEIAAPISDLERAALETGVVTDASHVSPVGVYQRSHESGRDALCVVPAKDGEFRFGAQAIFGTDSRCEGHGHARRVGDKLILNFSGGQRCIVVARYDGDRVAMPGVIDMACERLCTNRGSFEGVAYPRLTSDAGSARRVADKDGDPLCPAE